MFTNHRWKRAKARHTAPKEQQGQEARILGKTRRSGLQSEQKAFSETTPNLSLYSLHSLDTPASETLHKIGKQSFFDRLTLL